MDPDQSFFIALIVAAVSWLAFDWWRSKNSPYYRVLSELTRKLDLAEFSGEHASAQDFRAKLAWLAAIGSRHHGKEASTIGYRKSLTRLRSEDLKFPEKLDCRQPCHLEYANTLIQALAALFTSGDERHYRSREELPYPMEEILRAADAVLEHAARTASLDAPIYTKGYADSLSSLALSFKDQYLPIPKAALACPGRENLRVGLDYKRRTEDQSRRDGQE